MTVNVCYTDVVVKLKGCRTFETIEEAEEYICTLKEEPTRYIRIYLDIPGEKPSIFALEDL